MSVIVDTSAWSVALRRATLSPLARLIDDLIGQGLVQIIGPIRQELLSGIKSRERFDALRDELDVFLDLPLERDDYVAAAEAYNVCRARGVQGTSVDMLICAVAMRHDLTILTVDADFSRYARHLPIRLHANA